MTIKYPGRIKFDLPHETKKHEAQSSWKKNAFVLFDGDICDYYCWFLKKNFRLQLNKPLRGAHVSFINDRFSNEKLWKEVKERWNDKKIEIELFLEPKSDAKHWWMNVTDNSREELQIIRQELGLGKPYFGMHMSIGYVPEGRPNVQKHSEYIRELLINYSNVNA